METTKIVPITLILAAIALIALAGCITPPQCGNGVCEIGETPSNCPQDCPLLEEHFEC